jgi:hypothetical protein
MIVSASGRFLQFSVGCHDLAFFSPQFGDSRAVEDRRLAAIESAPLRERQPALYPLQFHRCRFVGGSLLSARFSAFARAAWFRDAQSPRGPYQGREVPKFDELLGRLPADTSETYSKPADPDSLPLKSSPSGHPRPSTARSPIGYQP